MSATMHTLQALADVLAAPDPTQAPTSKNIDTNGIIMFFGTKIAPILLAGLGIIFVSRAAKGEASKVLTSSAIAFIGLAFIAGAGSLLLFGDGLIGLFLD